MTPEAQRLAVQREAAASQHIVVPALSIVRELVRTSLTFREFVLREARFKPTHCSWCKLPVAECTGHPDVAGR